MGSRLIDRRRQKTPFLFANDKGSLEQDRRNASRRERERFRVHLWVELKSEEQEEIELVFASELSEVGLFIQRVKPLELSTQVQVLIHLPGQDQSVVALSQVASIRLGDSHAGGHTGNGLKFLKLSEGAPALLQSYLAWIREGEALPIDLPTG